MVVLSYVPKAGMIAMVPVFPGLVYVLSPLFKYGSVAE